MEVYSYPFQNKTTEEEQGVDPWFSTWGLRVVAHSCLFETLVSNILVLTK